MAKKKKVSKEKQYLTHRASGKIARLEGGKSEVTVGNINSVMKIQRRLLKEELERIPLLKATLKVFKHQISKTLILQALLK